MKIKSDKVALDPGLHLPEQSSAPSTDAGEGAIFVDQSDGNVKFRAESDGAIADLSAPTDANAIHDNVAAEISAITEKATPVSADLLLIEDSAAANAKRRVQVGNLPGGSGTDANAIHDNTAAEISAITEKTTPVGADLFIIEDSADSFNKKKLQATNLPGGTDANAIHDNTAAEISAITEKTTPVSADLFIIEDSADSFNKKKLQVTNLPSTDPNAIHDNVSNEIHAVTLKATPVSADELLIEDSAASWAKKRVAISTLPTGADANAIHDNVSAEISAITEKTTPVSADLLLIEDSAASNAKKRVQVGNLPGGGGSVASWGRMGVGSITNYGMGGGGTGWHPLYRFESAVVKGAPYVTFTSDFTEDYLEIGTSGAGLYLCNCFGRILNDITNPQNWRLSFAVNSSVTGYSLARIGKAATSSDYIFVSFEDFIDLSSGDKLSVHCYNEDTSSHAITGNLGVAIHRIEE